MESRSFQGPAAGAYLEPPAYNCLIILKYYNIKIIQKNKYIKIIKITNITLE